MRVRNRIEYVFTSGFTAQGYYSHLPALLKSIEKVILLQGAPGAGVPLLSEVWGSIWPRGVTGCSFGPHRWMFHI